VGKYGQWASTVSGQVRSVGKYGQWASTVSGQVRSVGKYGQWVSTVSGQVRSVGTVCVRVGAYCTLQGRVMWNASKVNRCRTTTISATKGSTESNHLS
jgi:hypothetical protein